MDARRIKTKSIPLHQGENISLEKDDEERKNSF